MIAPSRPERPTDLDHSRHRVIGVWPHLGGLEAEDDVLAGDAGRDELLGDRAIGSVVLYPDLPVDDVDVHDAAMHPAFVVPADVHDLVVVLLRINDGLGVDLT